MYENLMEAVVGPENATRAWKAVKRNQGAPGIDGMTTEQLRDHIRRHWATIRTKLLEGTYVPSPVRRKEIAKPDGGVRWLGIPTVFDRVNHDILMHRVGRTIRDKRVLGLIGRYLRAGVMIEGGGAGKRGGNAARRTALPALGQHLPGRAGPGTGTTRTDV
jgi:retron-type reverse transcriptase